MCVCVSCGLLTRTISAVTVVHFGPHGSYVLVYFLQQLLVCYSSEGSSTCI